MNIDDDGRESDERTRADFIAIIDVLLTVRLAMGVRMDTNTKRPTMNGLSSEAIARVRRQTRHTNFNNQSENVEENKHVDWE